MYTIRRQLRNFYPFEKQFDQPATAVELRDGERRKGKVVDEKDEELVVLGIVELHVLQPDRIACGRLEAGQNDGLVWSQRRPVALSMAWE